jgi:hypothetical protein
MSEPENWLPVPCWEDIAEVSDQGRVRTLDRDVALPPTIRRDGKPTVRRHFGRMKTPEKARNGYLRVQLQKGARVNLFVHRIVCEAFNGPKPFEGAVCRHLNDDAYDNRAVNLAWGTVAENKADAQRNGKGARGDRVNTAKLTEADVIAIRVRVGSGEACSAVQKDFGVKHSTIWNAAFGKTWKHLGGAVALPKGGDA